MRKIFVIALTIFSISMLPRYCFAYTEITGFFLDEGVSTLARGGLKRLPESQEKLDFNSPLFLDSHGKLRSDVTYEHQRTIRVYDGSWAGSHAYSNQLEGAVAAPFSLWNGALAGSVAAGYSERTYDVKVESSKEGISVSALERFSAKKGGLFLKALDKVSLGIALVDTDYRSRPEIPVEVSFAPVDFLSIGYKRSYTDIAGNISGLISGSNGAFPVSYAEDKNELSLRGEYKGIIMVRYARELQQPENYSFIARVELPESTYLAGDYVNHRFKYNEAFSVNDLNGGYLKGEGGWREYRIGAGADLGSHWNVEANFRRQNLDSTGGGVAKSIAILGFWPSLLVGNYNYQYTVALESDQYHLGAEYKGDNASFGFGCQYLDVKPVAVMKYTRNLFGLNKETIELDTDRIQLFFLSLGAGYRWDMFSVKFAFGQFIPIATHIRSTANTPAVSSNANSSTRDVFSSIGDYINRNPGGNIVRFMASFVF